MTRAVTQLVFILLTWTLGVCSGVAQKLAYLHVNDYKLQQARSLERHAIRTHDSLQLAEAWFLFGETYELVGDNGRAEPYYLKALRILEPKGNSFELVKLYVGLSELEQRQRHFTESLLYATKSLQVAQQIKSAKGLIIAYRMLGHIRHFLWNDGKRSTAGYDSVLFCYRQSERLSIQLKDTLHIAEANAFLGSFFIEHNYPEAIPCLKKALYLFSLKDNVDWEIRVLVHLSRAYLNTGRLPLAWRSIQQAQKLYTDRHVNEHGIRSMLESTFLGYYMAKGDWKQAFERAEKLKELEKQQLLADREGAISQLNVAYETKKKEELLKTQKAELALRTASLHTQQRFTLIYVSLFFIATGLSIVFFNLYRKNQRISRRNEELLREHNHRVKNNLQVVSSLLSLQSKQLTDEAAKKAVEESRLRIQSMVILHQKLYADETITDINIDEFIQEVSDGVLKAFGYPSVKIQFSINDISLTTDQAIPVGLIVNELITNACKYALPGNENPFLSISCYRKANKIILDVADNGPGLEGPGLEGPGLEGPSLEGPGPSRLGLEELQGNVANSRNQSFGMKLIRSQVRQLKGVYRFDFLHPAVRTGTRFTLEFNG